LSIRQNRTKQINIDPTDSHFNLDDSKKTNPIIQPEKKNTMNNFATMIKFFETIFLKSLC